MNTFDFTSGNSNPGSRFDGFSFEFIHKAEPTFALCVNVVCLCSHTAGLCAYICKNCKRAKTTFGGGSMMMWAPSLLCVSDNL